MMRIKSVLYTGKSFRLLSHLDSSMMNMWSCRANVFFLIFWSRCCSGDSIFFDNYCRPHALSACSTTAVLNACIVLCSISLPSYASHFQARDLLLSTSWYLQRSQTQCLSLLIPSRAIKIVCIPPRPIQLSNHLQIYQSQDLGNFQVLNHSFSPVLKAIPTTTTKEGADFYTHKWVETNTVVPSYHDPTPR